MMKELKMEVVNGYSEELEYEIKKVIPNIEIKTTKYLTEDFLSSPIIIEIVTGVATNLITELIKTIWNYLNKRPNIKIRIQDRIIISKDDEFDYIERVIKNEVER